MVQTKRLYIFEGPLDEVLREISDFMWRDELHELPTKVTIEVED